MSWNEVVLLFAVVIFCVNAQSQQAKEGSDWHHVQALPLGTSISVRAHREHARCQLSAVTDDALTCSSGGKSIAFERSDIGSIKISHRVRSTLIGTGVGAGAGAITGFAVGTGGNSNDFFGKNAFRGAIAGIFAAGFGVVGAGVGAGTDFSKSTVYRAP